MRVSFPRLPVFPFAVLALGLALVLLSPSATQADDVKDAAKSPLPEVVVHVPVDEMDVLLDADRRGVVLRHDEYQRLFDAARARATELGALPPVDGALLSATGSLDLTSPLGARLAVTYEVEVLAPGKSIVPFAWNRVALESVEVVSGEGRYEELDGQGRLRFEGPGRRSVEVVGYASPSRKGERRLIDVTLAPAAAMALDVKVPAAAAAALQGEGQAVSVSTGPDRTKTIPLRPARSGRLRVAWQPAARGTEGPPVLDVDTRTLHTLEDGLIRSRIVVQVDVLRTPIDALDLEVPKDLALRAVGGKHVTGSVRGDDRQTLRIDLDQPRRGRITLTLDGETPYQPQAGLVLPGVVVKDAVRQRGKVALRPTANVKVHDVRVDGGRRLVSARQKGGPALLQYALASAAGRVLVDLVEGDVRLEAASTYYLNLTEPAKTLIAATTYTVKQGTAFELSPRFAPGFALRTLLVNGQVGGFRYDQKDDGTLEVRLESGVREGGRIELTVMLEQAGVDWVPDQGSVQVPFSVPSAGAAREEGFVGVGADASFRVLDAAAKDLVSVGAAQLTSRGVSPAGLVYGYRLDGDAPEVSLQIERRTPRVEAAVVTHAHPTPRRLVIENVVFHSIERAGVRVLFVDAPTWARDVVRFEAVDLVAATRMEEAPAGVPDGYDRWQVTLARRVLGDHATLIRYWEDQEVDDWSVSAERPLAVRIPLERVERSVVVARAQGLEVTLTGDAPVQDLAELPPQARVDALLVREVVRLDPTMDGPGIAVHKHDGAQVLEAIAPLVALETAVAKEGILRTRARVVLVNVGLQYLRVALPAGSHLIGAVVDDESVKPLSDRGVLLIPIPPARRQGAPTTALLTYETDLGEEATGDVVVPAPEFPGLEVVKTTHKVAFDPRVEVQEIHGDFGRQDLRRVSRTPWIARLLAAPFAAGDDALLVTSRPSSGPRPPDDGPGQSGLVDFVPPSVQWPSPDMVSDEEAPLFGAEVEEEASEWTTAEGRHAAASEAMAREVTRMEALTAENIDLNQRARQSVAQARDAQRAQDRAVLTLQQERHRALAEQQDLFRADREAQKINDKLAEIQRAGEDVRRAKVGQSPAQPREGYARVQVPARYETVVERLADGTETTRQVLVNPAHTNRMPVPEAVTRPAERGVMYRGPANAVPPGVRMPTDPTSPPPPASVRPGDAPPANDMPVADPARQPQRAGAGAGGPGRGGGGRGVPSAGGEGPSTTPTPTPPRPGRRKGLLSLNVPVLLSPNVVRAERLGGGGVMTVVIQPRAAIHAGYWFGVITTLAVGLALATRGRAGGWLVPIVGFLLALLVGLCFQETAGEAAVAIADGTTVLIGVLVIRWLVKRLVFSRAASASKAAATALLVFAFLAFASDARADEKQAPEPPAATDGDTPTVETPNTVYVPYDPDDPNVPRPNDRVFIPLDTYLMLRKLAHPEEDPDVLAKGRVVALIGAEHTLSVGKEEATGALNLRFSKRGEGLSIVPLPLGGMAVSRATLDGVATPLLLKNGVHHLPLDAQGDHDVVITFRVPLNRDALGRSLELGVPPFAAARLDLRVDDFQGDVKVPGAGRIAGVMTNGRVTQARAFLGPLRKIQVVLEDPIGAEPEVPLRTRVESHVVHSIRDGGTESRALVTLHVLQGEAKLLDLDLPPGVSVLSAGGKAVARWEVQQGRLRLVFAEAQTGRVQATVVLSRLADAPTREEALPTLSARDTTGERGVIVVNADPFLRIEPLETKGLLRTATPRDKNARGSDRQGRVAGAWHFSARPTTFRVRIEEAPQGLSIESVLAVAFGDDHVRSRFDATLQVDARVPVGDIVFDLPGTDEVRKVTGQGIQVWWLEGEGEARTLHLRYDDLQRGTLPIRMDLARRLGGKRDAVAVPRWRLRDAKLDRGRLVLFAQSDVEPDPGRLPGLRSIPLSEAPLPASPVADATPRRAFRWEEPTEGSIPVTLRTPSLEVEAVVVSSIHPGDEAHRLEHLVLFDIRRGFTDRFDVFVPDGGLSELDVVRTRDMREIRKQSVVRRGPDDREVPGTLYEVRLQAPREGIVEVIISQLVQPEAPVRVVRPEQVAGEGGADKELKGVRWFGMVRAFLDGEVGVRPIGDPPDEAEIDDLPFLPTGLERQDVVRTYVSRAPYVLGIEASRHRLRADAVAKAIVRAARADIVLGRDGHARVRAQYRLFNRRRQFLRLSLPKDAVLFGVTVAGRPAKPLEGLDGDLMIPVPKVPLGGAGYLVAVLYRAPAGARFPKSQLDISLPEVKGVDVDRTVVRLFVPNGYDVDVESEMMETEAEDVAADLAEAAVREAKELIKVAKDGTLEQRQRAASNLGVIVNEANELNRRSGNKRVALGREVQQVEQDFYDNAEAIVKDLDASKRQFQGQQRDVFAGNAMTILGNDAQIVAAQDGARAVQQGRAAWEYNPTQVPEEGKKQEIAQLKKRLGKALEKRAAEEVMDFQVEIAQASDVGGLVMGDGKVVQPDETWANFSRLNGCLIVDQNKNRQLGVIDPGNDQTQVFFGGNLSGFSLPRATLRFSPEGANLDDVTSGLEDMGSWGLDHGGTGLAQGAALNPSSGIYFDDGGDGDFRGRTENTMASGFGFTTFGLTEFADREGDGFFSDRVPQIDFNENVDPATVTTHAATRSGLMGIDVPLPKDGQVFHFRAARSGAPLRITISEEGTGGFVRWLGFLAGLLALAVGLTAGRLWLGRRAIAKAA